MKDNKILALVSLLVLSFFMFPLTPAVEAAATIPVLTNDPTKNIAFSIDYAQYPRTVDFNLNGVATSARLRALRTESPACPPSANSLYKTLPWLAQKYATAGTEDFPVVDVNSANNMYSSSDCTQKYVHGLLQSGRYFDGGVNGANGGWMPPQAYGNWAFPGSKAGTSPFSGKTWAQAIYNYSGTGSNNFTQKFSEKTIWTSKVLPDTDAAYTLFRNNGHSTYNSYSDEKLLSSGTSFFRNEFSLTAEQLASVTDFRFLMKVDDFAKVYLNGVPIDVITQYATAENNTGYAGKSVVITRADLLSKYSLNVGNNVLAFQVNDKAVWADARAGSTSNAAGLWYQGTFSQTTNPPVTINPTCSCNVVPSQGTAPIVATATVNVLNGTGTYNVSVNFDSTGIDSSLTGTATGTIVSPNTSIKSRHTYLKGGLYRVTYTVTGNNINLTNQPCGSGNTVDVKNPSSNTGGEVAP